MAQNLVVRFHRELVADIGIEVLSSFLAAALSEFETDSCALSFLVRTTDAV
jgi:hypothetical protein